MQFGNFIMGPNSMRPLLELHLFKPIYWPHFQPGYHSYNAIPLSQFSNPAGLFNLLAICQLPTSLSFHCFAGSSKWLCSNVHTSTYHTFIIYINRTHFLILYISISVREKQWQTTPKNLPTMQRARAIPVA
jgi:hypothetical protein